MDDTAEEAAKKRRSVRDQTDRRDIQVKVQRWMEEHLQHIPAQVLETAIVNGKTARARVTEEMLKKPNARLTKEFANQMDDMYAGHSGVLAALRVEDPQMPCSDALITALNVAGNTNNSKRSIDTLASHLQSKKLNQKEIKTSCSETSCSPTLCLLCPPPRRPILPNGASVPHLGGSGAE